MTDRSQASSTGQRTGPPTVRRGGTGSSTVAPHNESPPRLDVWSRSGSKYRVRAVTLLALNVLLFAGVGCFAFWLRSGVVFAPGVEGYWDELADTFRFGHDTTRSLAHLLIEPISVQDVPMQIPIIGLLMATLVSIPILTAMLYRFWSSLPFILVVGFLAVMPWLAITVACACILATVRPFRTRYRFVSALVGLVPIVVYLILAWSGSEELVTGRTDPIDLMKFIAPWVLAIVAAALTFALVLLIAKLVDYRPGAIAPLLAIMFALPVVLFEFHVGRDELHYRLLEARQAYHFADRLVADDLKEAALRRWNRHPMPRPRYEKLLEIEKQQWQFELASDIGPVCTELTEHQAELVAQCDWFLIHFPNSRYALNVLYFKAQALDTRVDPVEFRQHRWIRFYDDFPNRASRGAWEMILRNEPDASLHALALLRLAQLQAREGDVERAMDRLTELIGTSATETGPRAVRQAGSGVLMGMLEPVTPKANLPIAVERVLLEAYRLHGLLNKNRDPIYGYEPLCGPRRARDDFAFGFLEADPRHAAYADNLKRIKRQFPDCQIMDNIDLEIAKATPSRFTDHSTRRTIAPRPTRVELLEACVAKYPHRDALPEALYRLGAAYKADGELAKSEQAFARLMEKHPDSIWAEQAARSAPWPHTARLMRASP